jgi:hypothetical protein
LKDKAITAANPEENMDKVNGRRILFTVRKLPSTPAIDTEISPNSLLLPSIFSKLLSLFTSFRVSYNKALAVPDQKLNLKAINIVAIMNGRKSPVTLKIKKPVEANRLLKTNIYFLLHLSDKAPVGTSITNTAIAQITSRMVTWEIETPFLCKKTTLTAYTSQNIQAI